MCFGSRPKPPPVQPVPVPLPPPEKKVKKVENAALEKRRANRRQGGMRALAINRTRPNIGAQGAGARAV